MFTPKPIDPLSSEQVHEMFLWLDDLRASGLVNMVAAYPLLALNVILLALNASGRHDRIINTQDVFHGALFPGLLFVVLCLAVAWWIGHRAAMRTPAT